MSTDLNRPPDYDLLCQRLIEKTLEGKLQWQETAEEGTFLAAVKGRQTFEISRKIVPLGAGKSSVLQKLEFPRGSAESDKEVTLTVRDANGNIVLQFSDRNPSNPVCDLFRLAQRIANRVDERIESSLELLNQL